MTEMLVAAARDALDEEKGFKIPMPTDPKERAEYEAAIARRRAAGGGKYVGDSLSSVARDALASFQGDPSLERRFSGGDSLRAAARDALDSGGAVYEEGTDMWYCSWNGATYGPFPNRAAAIQRRIEVRATIGDAWNNVKQFGRYRLLEGTATDGGDWRVIGPRGFDATFSNRAFAEKQAQRESDIRPDGRSRDSLADLLDRVRGGTREATGDTR